MKMSDYFALPVYSGTQDVTIQNKEKPCIVSGTNTVLIARPKYIEAAIFAINNHDKLVESLREVIDLCKSPREHKEARERASKLLAELEVTIVK